MDKNKQTHTSFMLMAGLDEVKKPKKNGYTYSWTSYTSELKRIELTTKEVDNG